MLYILNTSVLTSYGEYKYEKTNLETVKKLLEDNEFGSAIGHQAVATLLTRLTGVNVPVNRINYSQKEGDVVIVFKLKKRPSEGQILTIEEMEKIGYEFGLLEKIK